MKRRITAALILILLTTEISKILGRVVIVRGVEYYSSYSYNTRLYFCVANEDEGALVWNHNLAWKFAPYKFLDRPQDNHVDHFYVPNTQQTADRKSINCNMYKQNECTNEWKGNDWEFTSSVDVPMGPVFDRRWEEFAEYDNFKSTKDFLFLRHMPNVGTLVLSVRGSSDAHVAICTNASPLNSFCYWIIIGGWKNKEWVIRKCAYGLPYEYPKSGSECEKKQIIFYDTQILSPLEWKTFIIKWNRIERSITLYDMKRQILKYVDSKSIPGSSKDDYYIFYRSLNPILFRFHIYEFAHTTEADATLTSPTMYVDGSILCVQMFIALCARCEIEIHLIAAEDATKSERLMTVDGSETAPIHDLIAWQLIRINATIPDNFGIYVRLKIISRVNKILVNPLWAVGTIHECPTEGAVMLTKIKAIQDYISRGDTYYWPEVTCQKLFNYGSEVVSAANPVRFTLTSVPSDYYCENGRIGPHCSLSCKKHLELNSVCQRSIICEDNICTCRAGLYGSNCETFCTGSKYGYGCSKTCDTCINKDCNYVSGQCNQGCNNTVKYYIPPFCKIGIDTLPPPTPDFVNETFARISLIAKDEYKILTAAYTFEIEPNLHQQNVGPTLITNNMQELITTFQDLKAGITYKVRGRLYVWETETESIQINGDQVTFTTLCTPSSAFEVTPDETTLMLDHHLQSHVTHPCPAEWYSISVEEVSTNTTIHNPTLMQFPVIFEQLTPFTQYKIDVYRLDRSLFTKKVYTLEAAPSEVQNLQYLSLSSTEVTLTWEPPLFEHGTIRSYSINLQTTLYLGCSDLNRQVNTEEKNILTSNTTIVFSNLHPYTRYTVTVVARTIKSGPENKIAFETTSTDLPTAAPSNFSITNYTLTWNDPEDCKTISGRISATKLKFWGLSNNIKSFTDERKTTYKLFRLGMSGQNIYGEETYKARAFYMRKEMYNESVYSELIFTTPAKAPPEVKHVEEFEVDLDAKTTSLRWKPPEPPTNGKIEQYSVAFCNNNCSQPVVFVNSTLFCELWQDYICATVKLPNWNFISIAVRAYNKNVAVPGPETHGNRSKEQLPDRPENFRSKSFRGGVVQLKWTHPWKTGAPLRSFVIRATLISTKLRQKDLLENQTLYHNYAITKYRAHYSDELNLLPSSEYSLSIYATTKSNYGATSSSNIRTVSSIAFSDELQWRVSSYDSTILLEIPTVLNDTENSAMYVIVVGPRPCEQYLKLDTTLSVQTEMKYYVISWIAAVLSTSEYSGKIFSVGDDRIYDGATNCPLYPQESYQVYVVVQAERGSIDEQAAVKKTTPIFIGQVPRQQIENWLVPIIVILLVVALVYFFYRRRTKKAMKKQAQSFDDVSLSMNLNYESIILADSPCEMRKSIGNSTPSFNRSLSRRSTPDILQATVQLDEKENSSSMVKVKDFQDYVKKIINSGHLEKQYEVFPRGPTKPCEYGKLPQNKSKNRYANLIAYDDRRVILKKLPDNPYSDYINANYISGYKKDKAYIATQGPKANTVIDFWRMIWQEEVHIICMLANVIENGKTKCEQYWPDIGKKKKYGEIVVLNSKHNVFADFTFRMWNVTCGQETRKIEHLHYTAWPDHGVPLYTHSVVTYLKKLLATPSGNGPVVVHCSAGVGRTGTIILCDICLRRAAAEGVVDVLEETRIIRSQRANMVDNKQQYLFAHLALVECLLALPTALTCNESLPAKIKDLKKQLDVQLQSLEDTAWQDEALRPSSIAQTLSAQNIAKNRYPDLILEKASRIYLKRYPPSNEDSDYLSAVYVDGVRVQNQYLASQLPMPNTLSDFWRMIAEFKVELIIMLQPPHPEDPTCCTIAPAIGELKPTSYIHLESQGITETECYTSQKILLTDNSEKPARKQSVTILCSSQWKPGKYEEPPPPMSLVTLWQATEKIARGDGPTVTLCHDGVFGCGLFLALSFLLERMAVERECDVCLAVRAIRRSRPDFVRSIKQLEYLYDAAIIYLQYFETYANFS